METTKIHTDRAPAALGPYSQGIRGGDYVFCAGQAGLDPATGRFVPGGVEEQTRRALQNLSAVLESLRNRFCCAVLSGRHRGSQGDVLRRRRLRQPHRGGRSSR